MRGNGHVFPLKKRTAFTTPSNLVSYFLFKSKQGLEFGLYRTLSEVYVCNVLFIEGYSLFKSKQASSLVQYRTLSEVYVCNVLFIEGYSLFKSKQASSLVQYRTLSEVCLQCFVH